MSNNNEITTLQDNIETLQEQTGLKEKLFTLTKKYRSIFLKRYYETIAIYQKGTFAYKWILTSLLLFTFTSIATIIYPIKISPVNFNKYSIYSSKPLTLAGTEYEV